MKKYLFLLLVLFPLICFANPKPIPENQAFQPNISITPPNMIWVTWKIAPNYHLYRDRMGVELLAPNTAKLDTISLPFGDGKIKDDALGEQQVYNGEVTVPISFAKVSDGIIYLKLSYQGCSAFGFCYPPTSKLITANFTKNTVSLTPFKSSNSQSTTQTVSPQDKISNMLSENNWLWVLLAFFGFGILLSLTPCCLPMIPILSGIIVGHGKKIKTSKAFILSLSYVVGMSLAYAIAGIFAGIVGSSLQALLQQPWIIVLFSLFFVVLALSLFGLYELQLPEFIRGRAGKLLNTDTHGHIAGTILIGALSTLVTSPCVTPPLIGALAYISKHGNAVLGGSALFVMGLGMGVPLIIFGTVGGKLLPKTGPWMNTIKSFFGVVLLAVAIWLLERILPGVIVLLLWAILFVVSGILLGAFRKAKNNWHAIWKGVGIVLLVYGLILVLGAALGNSSPLAPFSSNQTTLQKHADNQFIPVKSIAEINYQLSQARSQGKYAMLDFYADWCISCKELDKHVFSTPQVKSLFKNMIILRVDVTKNSAEDQAIEKHYNVIAPPTMLFFDKKGREIPSARIVGEVKQSAFIKHLNAITNT